MVYLLPREAFAQEGYWLSYDPVIPVARLPVTPEDFPFLDQIQPMHADTFFISAHVRALCEEDEEAAENARKWLIKSSNLSVAELSLLMSDNREYVRRLVMVWPDFEISEPVLSDKVLEVQVDDTPFWPHLTSHGDLPTVAVRIFRNGEQVGGNETRPYYLPHWGQVPQNMCYTVGMGVNETERGRGIGRYLMERSLFEMQGLGCRHAILDVDSGNYTALMLYTSMGYRTIYSACQMSKALESTESTER